MFKNITYRQKFQYLGIGTILVLIISYQLSISKTIRQYKIYKQYNSAVLSKNGDQNSLQMLQSRNTALDEILGRFILDTIDRSKNLLGVVGGFCAENDLKLKEYKPNPLVQIDPVNVITRSVTVEGTFINCLKFLHHLETGSSVGRVGSVLFKSYTDPGKNKTFLNCTVFVQNLIPD